MSRVHALAGVIHSIADGQEVGRIRLFRGDAEVESLPLIHGRHLRHQPSGKEPAEPESKLVYRRQSAEGTSEYAPHAIFHVTWPLTAAGSVIDRLEFSATAGPTSPFLMAVTVVA